MVVKLKFDPTEYKPIIFYPIIIIITLSSDILGEV